MRAQKRPSPNHDARPAGTTIDTLILHYTGMADEEAAIARLSDSRAKVSAHWFVREDGTLIAMVDEARRAWHAGVSSWAGATDINARSIGIEIHNPGHDFGYPDFPEVQMAAVIELARDILGRHAIPGRRVLAHSDVAPARKLDPGEKFPWARLHAACVGHWVEPAALQDGPALEPGAEGADVRRLQGRLADYGYGIATHGRYDSATEQVVAAFQRHYRPACVDGRADPSTRATLERLLESI